MDIQYITDAHGTRTAVLIPIEEWEAIKEKAELTDENSYDIPDWHIKRVMETSAKYKGTTEGCLTMEEVFENLDKK